MLESGTCMTGLELLTAWMSRPKRTRSAHFECVKALTLAGCALDTNALGGSSLRLGRLLLREAFVAAARTICKDDKIESIESAAIALQAQKKIGDSVWSNTEIGDTVATLIATTPPDEVALARAELEVTRLVEQAAGAPKFTRAVRISHWVIASLAAVVVMVVGFSYFALRRPWLDYTWFASSAWPGFPQYGKLSDHGQYDLIFHTNEEANPWVVVDMHETRSVKYVRVVNRTDWGRERGLPLILDLAGTDQHYQSVSSRAAPFDVWDVTFPPHKARYVRLRATGVTILHFREVQIQ